jgi:hypothetical protein
VPAFSATFRRSGVENDGIPSFPDIGALGVMHTLA